MVKPSSLLGLALALASPCAVAAGFDNFPVKSTNLDKAPAVSFFEVHAANGIDDMHPVHGIQTSDGGYLFVGKGIESEANPTSTAFAMKLTSAGKQSWTWVSKSAGANAANAAVQLPNGGDLIIVGYQTNPTTGGAQRSVTKLALTTGTEAWTSTDFGDASKTSNGAWECVSLDNVQATVLIGGLRNKPDLAEMSFKSYGNVAQGEAVAISFPVAKLAASGTVAPVFASGTDVAWTYTNAAYFTVKAARSVADGTTALLLYAEEQSATLVALKASGDVLWGPTDYGSKHGEGTDMVVAQDGTGFAISGHGSGGVVGSGGPDPLYGRLTLVGPTGAYMSSTSYMSTPGIGTNTLVKNECWGLAAVPAGGYVLGCGTGIENCVGATGDLLTKCKAGAPMLADTRAGAFARSPAIWMSEVFRTDAKGVLQWMRTDQYTDGSEADKAYTVERQSSSASEYVLLSSDGGIVSVNDEGTGVGILKFATLGSPAAGSNNAAAPTAAGGNNAAATTAAGSTTAGSTTAGDDASGSSAPAGAATTAVSTVLALLLAVAAATL